MHKWNWIYSYILVCYCISSILLNSKFLQIQQVKRISIYCATVTLGWFSWILCSGSYIKMPLILSSRFRGGWVLIFQFALIHGPNIPGSYHLHFRNQWTKMDWNGWIYIYDCGQEFLRSNGGAIVVNKRVQNAVLGCNLKNDRMVSVHFQGKPFTITVSKSMSWPVMLKKLKVIGSMKTYKTF